MPGFSIVFSWVQQSLFYWWGVFPLDEKHDNSFKHLTGKSNNPEVII